MFYKKLPVSGFEPQTSGNRKRPLRQLSHNHLPTLLISYSLAKKCSGIRTTSQPVGNLNITKVAKH